MTQGLTPREIIAQLDVEEIDKEIEALKEEMNALHALRKVALAKNGLPAASNPSGAVVAKRVAEQKETANEILGKFGPLPVSKLAERVGIKTRRATTWFLKSLQKDDRFSIHGETVSLSN